MDFNEIMFELSQKGTERTKKSYLRRGVKEPVFGVTIKDLNPIAKKIKINQRLAEQLYVTGNYDAMYLAGMIADAKNMTEQDFERWIDKAYCDMISDFTVAITLTQSPLLFSIADKWIQSGEEMKISAGWYAYCAALGVMKDSEFNVEKLRQMLNDVKNSIQTVSEQIKYSMNNFVITVAISFLPLHEEATEIAKDINALLINHKPNWKFPNAVEAIEEAKQKGKIGFKRKNVRC